MSEVKNDGYDHIVVQLLSLARRTMDLRKLESKVGDGNHGEWCIDLREMNRRAYFI